MNLVKGPSELGPKGAVNTLGDVLELFSILLRFRSESFHCSDYIRFRHNVLSLVIPSPIS
jgi:hypothetical protein